MRKFKTRSLGHLFLGALGLILTSYMAVLSDQRDGFEVIVVWITITVIFAFFTAFHFYAAIAFCYGHVDRVVGSKSSATLLKGETVVRSGAKIRAVKELLHDSGSDISLVFFIVGFRPWVCAKDSFL